MKVNGQLIVMAVLILVSSLSMAVPNIESWETDKGVKVYFVATDGLPILDAKLIIDAGSARDEEKHGVAALTSALLNQGAGNSNAQQIAERLESVGAQLGASTSRDFTTISYRSLTSEKELKTSWQLLKDILNKPTFPLIDFERIKQRTLLRIKQREESPGTLAQLALYEEIYHGHPYANAIQGDEASVQKIQREDLKQFYQKHYVANNLRVVLVGGISRQQAEKMVQDLVADLEMGEKMTRVPAVVLPSEGKNIHQEYPSQQTHFMYSLPVLKRNDPDYFPLYVGNHILGGSGFSSRIVKEIREKRGLAYSAYSYFRPMMEKGPFLIGLQTRNEKVQEASLAVKKTLQEFIQRGPTEEELVAAKKNLIGGFALKLDSNKKLLNNIVGIVVGGVPLDYLNHYMSHIEAVTRQQIVDAFQRRVLVNKMVMVTVGQAVEQEK